MITRLRIALTIAAAAVLIIDSAPVQAQSDILLQLRSGSPAGDRFRVDSAGGFVALGQLGFGIIPASGSGSRTMWYPFKSAFRSGGIGSGDNMWDDGNVGFYTWAGGFNTLATGTYSFAMGDATSATGLAATALGAGGTASGPQSFAAGLGGNARSVASMALGRSAWAGTSFRAATNTQGGATAIGHAVTADADWSTAMGYRASTAGFVGSFVWGGTLAGASAATDSARSTAAGQFTARAPGGVRFFSNTTMTTGVTLNAGGSTWNVVSDRARKENFHEVDGEDLLLRLRGVPVTSWNYTAEGRHVRHIGPMAQDWHAAFALNDDDLTINQGDFDGVNLAAVRALEQRTTRLADENGALTERLRQIEAEAATQRAELARLRVLETEVAELRELLRALVPPARR